MRINEYLKQLKWSQTDLARHAGVSPGTIKRAITGGTIAARSAQKIESALDYGLHTAPGLHLEITGLHVARAIRKRTRPTRKSAT